MNTKDVHPQPETPHDGPPPMCSPRGMPVALAVALLAGAVVVIVVGAIAVIAIVGWFRVTTDPDASLATIAKFGGAGPSTTATFSPRHAWGYSLSLKGGLPFDAIPFDPIVKVKLYDNTGRLIRSEAYQTDQDYRAVPVTGGPGDYHFAIDCPTSTFWTIRVVRWPEPKGK